MVPSLAPHRVSRRPMTEGVGLRLFPYRRFRRVQVVAAKAAVVARNDQGAVRGPGHGGDRVELAVGVRRSSRRSRCGLSALRSPHENLALTVTAGDAPRRGVDGEADQCPAGGAHDGSAAARRRAWRSDAVSHDDLSSPSLAIATTPLREEAPVARATCSPSEKWQRDEVAVQRCDPNAVGHIGYRHRRPPPRRLGMRFLIWRLAHRGERSEQRRLVSGVPTKAVALGGEQEGEVGARESVLALARPAAGIRQGHAVLRHDWR